MKERDRLLGELLKRALTQKGLSLRALSKIIEVDVSTLSRIFNNKQKPHMNHLEKLAKTLDIPLEELMKLEGYEINTHSNVLDKILNKDSIEASDVMEVCTAIENEEIKKAIQKELDKYRQYMKISEGRELIKNSFESKVNGVGQIGPVIDTIKKLYIQFCEMDSAITTFVLIGSALLYFIISPDVIPDFLFPIGFIDDVMAIKIVMGQIR